MRGYDPYKVAGYLFLVAAICLFWVGVAYALNVDDAVAEWLR